MIQTLDKKKLEKLLKEAEIPVYQDDEGDFFTVMEADEDFPKDVYIWFTLNDEGNIMTIMARSDEYELKESNLIVANKFNISHHFLTCVANEEKNTVGFDYGFNVEGLTEDYFKEKCIHSMCSYIWYAFTELVAE